MSYKRILFIGLGGAGQRHMRIFRDILPHDTEFVAYRTKKTTPLLNADFSINNESNVEEEYRVKLFDSLTHAFDSKPDLVVISNPTSLHYETALEAAIRNINIFVEKPFSHNLHGFEKFREIVLDKYLLFFVSYQRRFHRYVSQIKQILESGQLGKIMNINIDVASYVPSWHPYEDFRKLYACRSDLGGGVLLTEIHEIDLCYQYFGMPCTIYCHGGNYSEVNLDVEDTVSLVLSYPNFNVNLSISFMEQHNRRCIYIAGTKGHVKCNMDISPLEVKYYNKEDDILLDDSQCSMDEMFYKQAKYFFSEFEFSKVESELNAAHASLIIVEAAKQSMREAKAIEV